MNDLTGIILAIILLTNIAMAASSRLLHCIKIIAVQGLLIGLLSLTSLNFASTETHLHLYIASFVNIFVKFIVLPSLLIAAMRKTNTKRELEPFVGYSASVSIVFALTAASFLACTQFDMSTGTMSKLAIPTALATIFTGLFMIIARRKAITQVVGFLMFENGIAVFGAGLMLECGLLVELGILLDVLVLVFIMGIAIFHISREFSHIDADQLNQLGDYQPESAEPDSAL